MSAEEWADHPVAFFSWKPLPFEEQHSTIEKECLAIKLAIHALTVYIVPAGTPFHYSDRSYNTVGHWSGLTGSKKTMLDSHNGASSFSSTQSSLREPVDLQTEHKVWFQQVQALFTISSYCVVCMILKSIGYI